LQVRTIYAKQRWTVEELTSLVPSTLAAGLVNPAPPEPPEEKKG
jgi:hypothetical protein